MIFFLLKDLFLHIKIDCSQQKPCTRNDHLNQALPLRSLDDNSLLRRVVIASCLTSASAEDVR